jgi:Tfp pilus assembly protein PilO
MAMVLLAVAASGAYWAVRQARGELAAQNALLQQAKVELRSLQAQSPQRRTDFTHQLPPAQYVDNVVRDMGQLAQEMGMEVRSISLAPTKGTAQELGRIQISVSALAEYKVAKGWLGELLARHRSLGVETLALRASGAEVARADMQATLVLFVRD